MKAVVIRATGGPEQLSLAQVPDPEIPAVTLMDLGIVRDLRALGVRHRRRELGRIQNDGIKCAPLGGESAQRGIHICIHEGGARRIKAIQGDVGLGFFDSRATGIDRGHVPGAARQSCHRESAGVAVAVQHPLETEAAGLAAQRRTEANLQAMQAMLDAFQKSIEEDSDAVPSDFSFHMEVAKSTGNRHFADLMTYLGTMIIPRTRINTASSAPEGRLAYLQRVHGEHEYIFNAIRNQDADAARAAMRTHLANSKDRLRKSQVDAV